MLPTFLIDGNNLGHVLGHIDKASARYDSAGLLACLDGVARHLSARGQEVEMALFLDDTYAAERLGGWHVRVAPVPGGDADVAIRAYAQAYADRPLILISGDRVLCGDVAVWGVVCLSPEAFVSQYLVPARRAGFVDRDAPTSYVEASGDAPLATGAPLSPERADWGMVERQRQAAALARIEAMLRGDSPLPPEAYCLELSQWVDEAELALYLAERHLCPAHPDLTDPDEMVAAIREHCSRQPRYFTSGPVIDRVFRLFLCRSERTLSLDDLARLGQTRRRKVKAALAKHGGGLGIVVVW